MTDADLMAMIAQQYDLSAETLREDLINIYPETHPYESEEEAMLLESLARDQDHVVLGADHVPAFNPCTNYLVSGADGPSVPYSEVDPTNAYVLNTIARGYTSLRVLYTYDASADTQLNRVIRGLDEK